MCCGVSGGGIAWECSWREVKKKRARTTRCKNHVDMDWCVAAKRSWWSQAKWWSIRSKLSRGGSKHHADWHCQGSATGNWKIHQQKKIADGFFFLDLLGFLSKMHFAKNVLIFGAPRIVKCITICSKSPSIIQLTTNAMWYCTTPFFTLFLSHFKFFSIIITALIAKSYTLSYPIFNTTWYNPMYLENVHNPY